MKRAKRRNAPIFFSSQTMHLLNQEEANLRKLTKNWTLSLSLKQRELNKSFNESTELDKQIVFAKFILSFSSNLFRLLRTLGFSKSFILLCLIAECLCLLRSQMVSILSLVPFFVPNLNTICQALMNVCQSCV